MKRVSPACDASPLPFSQLSTLANRLARSNLHSFFVAITPRLTVSSVQDQDQTWNGQEPRIGDCPICRTETNAVNGKHYVLREMWKQFSDPYGQEVCLELNGQETMVYYIPFLSALSVSSSVESLVNNGPTNIPSFRVDFTETASPYHRLPLCDQIMQLAITCPQLLEAHSCQLDLENSWFCVYWQPILNDHYTSNLIAGSFLTYHQFNAKFSCPLKQFCPANFDPQDQRQSHELEAPNEVNSSLDSILPRIRSDAKIAKAEEFIFCPCVNNCFFLSIFAFVPHKVHPGTWYTVLNSVQNECISPRYLVNAARDWNAKMKMFHPDFENMHLK